EKESPAKKGKGKKESFLVAGGTDLFVQIPKKLEDGNLRFMSNRADLQDISEDDGFVVIGAGVSSQQLRNSPILNRLLPGIKENFNLVSSTIMRNRATAAGNIVNASPIGDISIMLLALDATLCLAKKDKKRELPLKSFFKGYKQMDLKKDEIIEFIKVPVPSKNSRYHFEKVSQRKILDIASCNSAISLETEDNCISKIHLSAGGVSPIPLFLAKTCAFLTGKAPAPGTLKEALGIMDSEISPISDVRGSARYKKRLLRHLVTAHFITLFPEENFEEVLA
ncbi:MAG: (2Fe-2S)-binding protein, partial [bacterium]|nr:(2Fe-2S)-binding protein [bacterium]